jgi:hypothetical protein
MQIVVLDLATPPYPKPPNLDKRRRKVYAQLT